MTDKSNELKTIFGEAPKEGGEPAVKKGVLKIVEETLFFGKKENFYDGFFIDGKIAAKLANEMPEVLELFTKNSKGKYITDQKGKFFIDATGNERLITALSEKINLHKSTGIPLREIEIIDKNLGNIVQSNYSYLSIPEKYLGDNKAEVKRNISRINSSNKIDGEPEANRLTYIERHVSLDAKEKKVELESGRVAILGGHGNFPQNAFEYLLKREPDKLPTPESTFKIIQQEIGKLDLGDADNKANNNSLPHKAADNGDKPNQKF